MTPSDILPTSDDHIFVEKAFYYLANPDGDKELEYFKKAYKANPSIKNTHNYAFWAYYEYGEVELALGLFQELIAKNPKSFYPYMAYAQLLLLTFRWGESDSIPSLSKNAHFLIHLYGKSIDKFYHTSKNYQQSHYDELAWIYTLLGNIYLISSEHHKAKENYQNALNVLMINLNNIDINDEILDEYRYFILYNLLILVKIEKNKKDYQSILTQLKECKSFNKYDVFYLKRKKANRLKRQLHHFSKCWLFGCESCGNLFDDGLADDK